MPMLDSPGGMYFAIHNKEWDLVESDSLALQRAALVCEGRVLTLFPFPALPTLEPREHTVYSASASEAVGKRVWVNCAAPFALFR